MNTKVVFVVSAVLLFALFVSSCKKPEDKHEEDIEIPTDNDSIQQVRIQAIMALLDSVQGQYAVQKRVRQVCHACPPDFQIRDSLYPDYFILHLNQIQDTMLEAFCIDISDTLLLPVFRHDYTTWVDEENLLFDPDIRMGYSTSHASRILSLFPEDSVSLKMGHRGLGGSVDTLYFGKKLQ